MSSHSTAAGGGGRRTRAERTVRTNYDRGLSREQQQDTGLKGHRCTAATSDSRVGTMENKEGETGVSKDSPNAQVITVTMSKKWHSCLAYLHRPAAQKQ